MMSARKKSLRLRNASKRWKSFSVKTKPKKIKK